MLKGEILTLIEVNVRWLALTKLCSQLNSYLVAAPMTAVTLCQKKNVNVNIYLANYYNQFVYVMAFNTY